MPTVQFDTLTYQQNGQDYTLAVGTPTWYTWLTTASTFTFTSEYGAFTAHKERSGNRRGGWYWKAYRKQGGKLHRAYLGKSEHLTLERLISVAQTLATSLLSTTDGRSHSKQMSHASSSHGILPQEPLLATKLYIPPTRSDMVARSRLIHQLNTYIRRKLTLVSAPAGFGKTNLLSAWCEAATSSGWRISWVSLETGDNDPTRFWSYVITALKTSVAEISDTILALLRSPQPVQIESVLVSLINSLTAIPDEIALILDDYHLIETPSIHNMLMYLIDHLPPQLHLVIASRVDPPLPIARLRTQGHLVELRMTDLRFTQDEAATFLNSKMGLRLREDDIATLEAKTEGWIAGLYLAAIALQGRSDAADFVATFTGKHRHVLDYLGDEVLKRLPEHIQTFLLQTSILDSLCSSLCDAVTEQANSEALLKHLEQANLFIVPLDDERRWYRYHQLFAEFLQGRLQHSQPVGTQFVAPISGISITELHRRAARWYEFNGFVTEAVNHALKAADFDHTRRLIEQHAEIMMKRGEITTLLNWLRALPNDLVRTLPRLSLILAWVLVFNNSLDAAEASLQDAERTLYVTMPHSSNNVDSSDKETHADVEQLPGEVVAVRASIASLRGDTPRTIELARQALELLPKENLFMRGTTALRLGTAYLWSGELAAAEQALDQARSINQAAGNALAALSSVCSLGYLYLIQGHFQRAAKIFRKILDDAGQQGGGSSPIVSMAHGGMGELLCEWYELEAAEKHLQQGIALGKQWGFVGSLVHDYMSLANVEYAGGDIDGALALLHDVDQIVQQYNIPQGETITRFFRVRLELAQGNVDAAARRIQEVSFNANKSNTSRSDSEYLTLVRVRIAQGQFDEAKQLIEPLLQALHEQEPELRLRTLIETLVLQALVLQAQNKTDQAMTTLTQALSYAESEGYVLTFVNEGQPMLTLLLKVLDAQRKGHPTLPRRVSPMYISKLLAIPGVNSTEQPTEVSHQGLMQLLFGSLSERELEVLQRIAAGMSNHEIAQEFVVSVGTIKTHINNLYGKLNVHSRTQAIARARELHLL